MATGRPVPDGVNGYRAAAAVVVCLFFGLVVVATDEPITPAVAAMLVAGGGYFVVSAFDAVRDHPAYDLGSAVWLTVVLALWYAAGHEDGVLLLALTVLSAFGVVVEAYNYRYDASLLRIDY